MTKVSVIVPNYNHGKYLNKRLESIFNQTFQNFEVILLDDRSADNSKRILSEYSNHPKVNHICFNETNSGNTFKQWNKGINLAKGNYIWIAESDDYSDNQFLEKLVKMHIANPEISLAFCQSHRVNSESEITGNWITHTFEFGKKLFTSDFVMDGNEFIEKYLIHKNVIPNVSGVLFKSSALNSILPLEIKPFLKYNADWFYYIQLLCNSKVAFISESLNYFRYHEKSVIGRAGNESGWLKIFKMELEGRNEMLTYLKKCNASNFNTIRKQSEIGNLKLKYLTAKGFINNGEILRGILVVRKNPSLLKKVLKDLYRKML